MRGHKGGDGSFFAKGKVFLESTSVCVFILNPQEEQSLHVEERRRAPARLQVFAFSGVTCVLVFVLRVTFLFFCRSSALRRRSGGEEEPLRQAAGGSDSIKF